MIDKIKYRLVYNRKNELNNQGTALVQVEALLHRRKIYLSTNVYLRPSEWDKSTAQVVNHPQQYELNSYLYEKILGLQSIEISFWKRGVSPTLMQLKESLKMNFTKDITFFKFAKNVIVSSTRKDGTKQNMMATINRMKDFRGDLEINDIDYRYLTEFEIYLREIGLKVNSIGKHLRNLRTLINEAINQGYLSLSDYPFRKFKIRKEKTEHRVLTRAELLRLENLSLKSKSKQRVLDSFLFCCYAGLRFSDYKRLTDSNLIFKNGKAWLTIRAQKTDIRQMIPIYLLFDGKGLDLLAKYISLANLARIGCNADVNRTLKEITKSVGITKRITFHSSRHTFATLLLADGVPITTIQRLLGHTSVKTTQIYSEVLDDTLISDLKKGMRIRKK